MMEMIRRGVNVRQLKIILRLYVTEHPLHAIMVCAFVLACAINSW